MASITKVVELKNKLKTLQELYEQMKADDAQPAILSHIMKTRIEVANALEVETLKLQVNLLSTRLYISTVLLDSIVHENESAHGEGGGLWSPNSTMVENINEIIESNNEMLNNV